VDVGASIGTLLVDRTCDPAVAIAEADRLMYQSKHGRPAKGPYLHRLADEQQTST
jgi:hypothetical protein